MKTMTQQNLTENAYDIDVLDPITLGYTPQKAQEVIQFAQSLAISEIIERLTDNSKNIISYDLGKKILISDAYLMDKDLQRKVFIEGEKQGLTRYQEPKVA